MPGRSAPPTVGRLRRWWTSAFASVPSCRPLPGCTVSPEGLSSTRSASSSWSTASGRSSGTSSLGAGGGTRTTTVSPPLSFDFPASARPSTSTRPASIQPATTVRECSGNRSASALSRRVPATSGGKTTVVGASEGAGSGRDEVIACGIKPPRGDRPRRSVWLVFLGPERPTARSSGRSGPRPSVDRACSATTHPRPTADAPGTQHARADPGVALAVAVGGTGSSCKPLFQPKWRMWVNTGRNRPEFQPRRSSPSRTPGSSRCSRTACGMRSSATRVRVSNADLLIAEEPARGRGAGPARSRPRRPDRGAGSAGQPDALPDRVRGRRDLRGPRDPHGVDRAARPARNRGQPAPRRSVVVKRCRPGRGVLGRPSGRARPWARARAGDAAAEGCSRPTGGRAAAPPCWRSRLRLDAVRSRVPGPTRGAAVRRAGAPDAGDRRCSSSSRRRCVHDLPEPAVGRRWWRRSCTGARAIGVAACVWARWG